MSSNPTDSNKSYSQNDEQDYILNFFQNADPGKFLDIGGFHPTLLSNTRCLIEKGWAGVYVEPSPLCMETFRKLYWDDPNIELVEKAVALQEGEMEFYESGGDAVSTFDARHRDKWASKINYTTIKVQTITMANLLKQYGKDVTFLSLDVEGMNYTLFLEIPPYFWDQLQMVVIEHDNFHQEMTRILAGFGFSKLAQNAENIILAKI
jgi:FkbM family methyltransferase